MFVLFCNKLIYLEDFPLLFGYKVRELIPAHKHTRMITRSNILHYKPSVYIIVIITLVPLNSCLHKLSVEESNAP